MTPPAEPDDRDARQSPYFKAFEAKLAALRPREDRLDRDMLMYRSGQASLASDEVFRVHAPRRWAWPASLGALFGSAAAAVVMLFAQPFPTSEVAGGPTPPPERIVIAAPPLSSTFLPFDLASPHDKRRLTAGALASPARLIVVAEPQQLANDQPTDAPTTRPSLTTRSLREVLEDSDARALSS